MRELMRLPALPLVTCDPYFSIWSPYDTLTDGDTQHWCGQVKPIRGRLTVDGSVYRFIGGGSMPAMTTVAQTVTPTATTSVLACDGVELTVTFRNAALPKDWDLLSVPATVVAFSVRATDGRQHECDLYFTVNDKMCYQGDARPEMNKGTFLHDGLSIAFTGKKRQELLCGSGDHVTIDWGYLMMASRLPVTAGDSGPEMRWSFCAQEQPCGVHCYLAYDDVASILYYGTPCKAWYARKGKTLPAALAAMEANLVDIWAACDELDERVLADAQRVGGEDYRLICAAAWRHTFAAHKLIATPSGEPAWISKENDSNGCAATVDVSYPSTPLFLAYSPKLVEAMCRPVLEFAAMPVWNRDFAPHDVGQYPIIGGQVYGLNDSYGHENNYTHMPWYLYPAENDVYKERGQMPVEECGNMLIMLTAAATETGDLELIKQYRGILDMWVRYLVQYGADPGEQLCTDDFAGHLAHNVNLSAKAIVGIACYGRMLDMLGEDGSAWSRKAKVMAADWYERCRIDEGTALTFDGVGWSMKYNLAWDKPLKLGLMDEAFYRRETESYLNRLNTYGLPLDSRAAYTKSDWEAWCASLAPDYEVRCRLLAPIARYLRESQSRVAFSDWYDTNTGKYEHFIGRSVQGGMFMPLYVDKKQ